MAYDKTTWVDGQNKYAIKDQSDNIIQPDVKLVYTGTGGTPISSTNLNKIEQGILDSHNMAETESYTDSTSVTQQVITLPSDFKRSKLKLTLKGRTVVNIAPSTWSTSLDGWTSSYDSIVSNKYRIAHTADTYALRTMSGVSNSKYYFISLLGNNASNANGAYFVVQGKDSLNILKTSSTLNSNQSGRLSVVLQPTDMVGDNEFYLVLYHKGSGYIDFSQFFIVEITSTEYALGASALLNKYAYHDGMKHSDKMRVLSMYEPIAETTAIIPTTLRSISDTICDTFDCNTGKYTKNVSDVLDLLGISFNWGFAVDATASKLVSFDISGRANDASGSSTNVYKYTNEKLVYSVDNNVLDHIEISGSTTYINLPDIDTGWDESWVSGTSFTGMTWANLIKAYMNGWKLTTANTNVASCVWTGIASGTTQSGSSGYTHVTTTQDSGYQPYRMLYQLATPVTTNYYPNTLTAEPSGTVYVNGGIKETNYYNSGITITNSYYPISNLISVDKVNTDFSRSPIALSACTVASNGLSFTIAGASSGDKYEYVYEHNMTTIPTMTYLYGDNISTRVDGLYNQTSELDSKVEQTQGILDSTILTLNSKIERYAESSIGSDAYVANNINRTPALYIGMFGSFKADVSNTGASTLNYDGLGVKNLKVATHSGKVDTATGDIIANLTYYFYYDGTDYVIINPTAVRQSILTTQGDMPYATGSNTWGRLAKGNANQALKMNSGGTAPEWATDFTASSAFTIYKDTVNTSVTSGTATKYKSAKVGRVGSYRVNYTLTVNSSPMNTIIQVRKNGTLIGYNQHVETDSGYFDVDCVIGDEVEIWGTLSSGSASITNFEITVSSWDVVNKVL